MSGCNGGKSGGESIVLLELEPEAKMSINSVSILPLNYFKVLSVCVLRVCRSICMRSTLIDRILKSYLIALTMDLILSSMSVSESSMEEHREFVEMAGLQSRYK